MKQKLMIIVMVISLAMQCISALPVYAVQQVTTEYNLILKNRYALKDMSGEAITFGKSLAMKETEDRILAYVLKEGGTSDNKSGGIYVYDVTNIDSPECIQYVGTIGGVDISYPPQVHNELELIETVSGDYIAFSDHAWNNTQIRAAKILDTGLIDTSYIINSDGEKTYGFDLESVGDYLFVSRKNLSEYQHILDVYRLENDTLSKKGSIATSTRLEGDEEEVEAYTVERDGNDFIVYAGVRRKDGISSNRYFEVHKGKLGNDGNITFTKQYTSRALENKEIFALARVGEDSFMLGTGNDNSDKTTYYLDADTYMITDAPAQYVNTICDLGDGYYVSAGRDNLQMYKDKETIQTLGGVTNLPEQMIKTDKYIYLLCWNNLEIYSYKTEVDIISDGGACIEPEYKLEATVSGVAAEDSVVVSFDGSDRDMTGIVTNGKLVTNIPVTNGEHVVEVKILRNGEVFLCDSVNINVAIEPQLKISNTQLTDNKISFDIENLYSNTLDSGMVVALSYDSAAMTGKGKLNLTTLDDVVYEKEITLEGYSSGNSVMIFAISSLENPKLISNVIRIGNVDFGAEIDQNSITRITEKPNAVQKIDPITNKFTTTAVSESNKEQEAIVLIFNNSAKTFENLVFSYALETDENGYASIEYTINDNPSEGDVYYTSVAMGQYNKWSVNTGISKSYYGIETSNAALTAIKGADENTIYTVLTTPPCSNVLQLDFTGDYDDLIPASQSNVLKKMIQEFNDVGDVINAFTALVAEQKIVTELNTVTLENAESKFGEKESWLGINMTTGLYTVLSPDTKTELYNEYIINKNFDYREDISKAFSQGVCMNFLTSATYMSIVHDEIIENHYAELGIPTDYANAYKNSNNKENIIKKFLSTPITDASKIGEMFISAYNNPKSDDNEGSSSRPSSGGGGGIFTGFATATVSPINPEGINSNQKPVDPDDEIVFNDVDKTHWYSTAVYELAKLGHISGISENEFAPDTEIKREEFVKIIVSAFGLLDNTADTNFQDTNRLKWHYRYIASAQMAGVVNGIDQNSFGVGNTLTREDMAVILDRVISKKNIEFSAVEDTEFADSAAISRYAQKSVKKMADAHIINGFPTNEFMPKATATRAQAAYLVWNIMNYKTSEAEVSQAKDNKIVYIDSDTEPFDDYIPTKLPEQFFVGEAWENGSDSDNGVKVEAVDDNTPSYFEKIMPRGIYEFEMSINNPNSWPQLILQAKNKSGYNNTDAYLIGFNEDYIELQRFNDGERTVFYGVKTFSEPVCGGAIDNSDGKVIKYGQTYNIAVGTVSEREGTRIVLIVNGETVINYLDTQDNRLTDEGFFGIYVGNLGYFEFLPIETDA